MTSFSLDPTPINGFKRDEANVAALRPVLADPVLQAALRAIEDSIPQHQTLPDQVPGVHHDTTIAHRYYWEQGARTALRTLRNLAIFREPKEAKQVHDQFEHIDETITL